MDLIHMRTFKEDGERGASYCGLSSRIEWTWTSNPKAVTCMDCYSRFLRNDPATRYSVRFIHKVGGVPALASAPIEIQPEAFTDRKTLGAALRAASVSGVPYPGQSRVLMAGESVREFREERGSGTVVFPRSKIWHSIILTREE